MCKRASALGIVIVLIVVALGALFITACTQKKDSSEEAVTEATTGAGSDSRSTVEKDSSEASTSEEAALSGDEEGMSVDEAYTVTIDENQGVDGF